jgi:ribonuclease HIII
MASHVIKLNEARIVALEAALAGGRFESREVPYARFALKGEGVSVVVYTSGKCVIQGKGGEQFLERYLPEEVEKRLEEELLPENVEVAIGSDESGKGDYFGPLVVAAVAYGPEYAALVDDLRLGDSKKMTEKANADAAKRIREVLPCATVVLRPSRYNQLYREIGNLNRLLAWAHGAALEKVLEICDAPRLIVDKFCEEKVLKRHFKEKALSKELILRTRAESHPAVGAASMLASAVFGWELADLGREIGHKLPKGAGAPVDAAARRLVAERGPSALEQVAKMHFKTTQKVLGS